MRRYLTTAIVLCVVTLITAATGYAQLNLTSSVYGTHIRGAQIISMCEMSNGTIFAITGLGLYRSRDTAASWQEVETPLDVQIISSANVVAAKSPAGEAIVLYLSRKLTAGSVFISGSEGNDWTEVPVPAVLLDKSARLINGGGEYGLVAALLPEFSMVDSTVFYRFMAVGATFERIGAMPNYVSRYACTQDGTLWALREPDLFYYTISGEHGRIDWSDNAIGMAADNNRLIIATESQIRAVESSTKAITVIENATIEDASSTNNYIQFSGSASGHMFAKIEVDGVGEFGKLIGSGETSATDSVRLPEFINRTVGYCVGSGQVLFSSRKADGPYLTDLVNYKEVNNGLHIVPLTIAYIINDEAALAITINGDVYYRAHAETKWMRTFSHPGNASFTTRSLVMTPSAKLFFASRAGVYQSTDFGLTWSAPAPPAPATTWPQAFDITVDAAGVLYATVEGAMVRSNDDGVTWNVVQQTLDPRIVVAGKAGIICAAQSEVALYDGTSFSQPQSIEMTIYSVITKPNTNDAAVVGVINDSTVAFSRSANSKDFEPVIELPVAINKSVGEQRIFSATYLPDGTILGCTFSGYIVLPAGANAAFQIPVRFDSLLLYVRYQSDAAGLVGASINGEVVRLQVVTSVNEDKAAHSELNVSPNPLSAVATITASAPIRNVVVYDISGTQVQNIGVVGESNSHTWSTSELPAGTYYVLVTAGSIQSFGSFVKLP